MANEYKTLAELVNLNDKNANDYGCSDLFDDSPLIRVLAAVKASNGTLHKYIKESGAPVVDFRELNQGKENRASSDTLVTQTLKLIDASFNVDKGEADAYRFGPEAYIAREAKRHLKATMFAFEKQILGGTVSGRTAGFNGLANSSLLNALSSTGNVVNATGTTANTGSSVYLIRTNEDTDLAAVAGNDGEISIGETVVTLAHEVTEDEGVVTNVRSFTAYHTPIMAHIGLQYGSVASVVRIANLTEDNGKGLTDALIYRALSLFPASRMPNLIVGNRRSRRQLQQSRTATNATGAPAPFPTEVEGIPFITTDAISNTEALLT